VNYVDLKTHGAKIKFKKRW